MNVQIILIVALVICGTIFSSFFSLLVMRFNGLTKVNSNRSQCDHCHSDIAWYDNIPIISFIFLRGKCRDCHKSIDPHIFLAEILATIVFIIWGIGVSRYSLTSLNLIEWIWLLGSYAVLIGFLYLAIYDLFTFSIPSKELSWVMTGALFLNLSMILYELVTKQQIGIYPGGLDTLVASIVAALAVYIFVYFSKEKAMGMGDVYVAAIVAMLTGLRGLLTAFYVMVIVGAIVGIVLAVYKGKLRDVRIPLLPFMLLGCAVGIFWGSQFANLFFAIPYV